uniref:Uncharacterized protein n=1 Tax=Scophthalmus maximus TaxID=52904 RepID=A0A8D3BCC9_SCOMX
SVVTIFDVAKKTNCSLTRNLFSLGTLRQTLDLFPPGSSYSSSRSTTLVDAVANSCLHCCSSLLS